MLKSAQLLYSDGPDWLYATQVHVSDPTFCYVTHTATHVLASPLDYVAWQAHSHLTLHTIAACRAHWPADTKLTAARIAEFLIAQDPAAEIHIGPDFPLKLYQELTAAGYTLVPQSGTVFPQRAVKTQAEVAKIRVAQQCNEAGFACAYDILHQAHIAADDTLEWQGQPLTAERLRMEMRLEYIRNGLLQFSDGPIVGCGVAGTIPHERGHGILHANQLIVIDGFPQHENFYWGDLTRTYLKGQPTPWQAKLYETVLAMQSAQLDMVQAGAAGPAVHQVGVAVAQAAGYETGTLADGTPYGFFHGTGHGVGLEKHDPTGPSLGIREETLRAGQVVTIEPGLYYPPKTHTEVGGCRIEDLVVVTATGYDTLTTLPKENWVIA